MLLFEDLKDSNYVFSSEQLDIFALEEHARRKYHFFWGLKRYVYHFLKSFKSVIYLPTLFKIGRNDGVVIITSLNQYSSIAPLLADKSLNIKTIAIDWKGREGVLKFPIFLSYLLSIFLIPQTLYFYFTCKDPYVKKSFHYGFTEYCLTFAYRFVNNIWLAICKPRFLLILSDHQMVSRDIVKSGRRNKIKTLYMQHASVTEKFPRLIMDYAFLEGNDAKDKYLEIAGGHTDTVIELVGLLKLDGIINITTEEKQIGLIGLCTNEFDDIEITGRLIALLKSAFNVLLRPHPRDPRYAAWQELANKQGVRFSESKTQGSADFLNEVNCIVSYNCNIIIESLMLNKPTFSFQLGQKSFDHYGFIAHDIVMHFADAGLLLKEITGIRAAPNAINWKNKAKYYCDTIGTPYEGRTRELLIELFKKYNI